MVKCLMKVKIYASCLYSLAVSTNFCYFCIVFFMVLDY